MADTFLRRNVNGVTPMDLKYMNDNFKYIWMKVFGNITTGDMLNGAVTGEKIAYDTITAKNIKAGTITAEEIKANTITALQIDTTTLVVGTNISMGANATIAWAKVTGTENVPDKAYITNQLSAYVTSTLLGTTLDNYATLSALADFVTNGDLSAALFDYVDNGSLSTILGEDYIITGKILANQIAAGNIVGCTIQTANSVNYSVLEDQYIEIYYGNVLKVHLGYDSWIGGLRSYLRLGENAIFGNASSMEINPGGASCLSLYSDHSAIFSGDLQVNGDLNVLGSVTFPSTAYTVVAKFA